MRKSSIVYRPSSIVYRLSSIPYWLSAIGYRLSAIVCLLLRVAALLALGQQLLDRGGERVDLGVQPQHIVSARHRPHLRSAGIHLVVQQQLAETPDLLLAQRALLAQPLQPPLDLGVDQRRAAERGPQRATHPGQR